jgi:lysine-N-methylase
MHIFYPDYYNDFRCIASACPDSCCKEWDVQVDPESALRYRALPGPLGDHLRSVLEDVDGETVMRQTPDRRCPMWRQDGLCEIQRNLGEAALCHVCARFPRLRHDYGDFVELGLELSCPEAARIILQSPAPATISDTVPGGTEPEYDPYDMEILRKSRDIARSIVNDATHSPGEALAALLLYGYRVQAVLDGDEDRPFAVDAAVTQAHALAQQGSMADIFELYKTLEILTPAWRALLSSAPAAQPWKSCHRALARYFIDRYWLQTVSDLDLVGRVKFIIVSCLMIRSLSGDPLHTAQLYSKEIENDADNVYALLDAAYTSPALTDVKLLGLLLSDSPK